jgi:hypothetical protein
MSPVEASDVIHRSGPGPITHQDLELHAALHPQQRQIDLSVPLPDDCCIQPPTEAECRACGWHWQTLVRSSRPDALIHPQTPLSLPRSFELQRIWVETTG